MTVQATVRTSGNVERTLLARAVYAFVSVVNEGSRKFFARVMAALDESRRREAARLLHRYRDLIDDRED